MEEYRKQFVCWKKISYKRLPELSRQEKEG